MDGRILMLCTVLVAGVPGPAGAGGEEAMDLERQVCGLKEPFLFWLWSGMAGRPDAARVAGLRNVEDIAFGTGDRRTLRGYRLKATGADGQPVEPRGYLLVMQGNAILADSLIGRFASWAADGYDVYLYDYRGYGRSDGRRRLQAIVSDYTEIRAALDASGYARRLVYAFSFGGIVLLDGLGNRDLPDRIVVDSTPARLSNYGCPADYDPVAHLPEDCGRFLFVTGRDDAVVTPAMSRELVETARARGARVLEDDTFGHPFMERDPSAHARRMRAVGDFLLGTR
jgi:hypothetical protein